MRTSGGVATLQMPFGDAYDGSQPIANRGTPALAADTRLCRKDASSARLERPIGWHWSASCATRAAASAITARASSALFSSCNRLISSASWRRCSPVRRTTAIASAFGPLARLDVAVEGSISPELATCASLSSRSVFSGLSQHDAICNLGTILSALLTGVWMPLNCIALVWLCISCASTSNLTGADAVGSTVLNERRCSWSPALISSAVRRNRAGGRDFASSCMLPYVARSRASSLPSVQSVAIP